MFGRGLGSGERGRAEALGRRNVNNPAVAIARELGQTCARQTLMRRQHHVHRSLPSRLVFLIGLRQRRADRDSRVIHENVDVSERRLNLGYDFMNTTEGCKIQARQENQLAQTPGWHGT